MSGVLNLIAKCRELGLELAPGPEGKLRVRPPGMLPEELREELRRHKPAILAYLKQAEKYPPLSREEKEFLALHARNLPWQESPGWEALQEWFKPLRMYVWLVRDRETGEEYARSTGTPALVISEVVARQWRTPEEARAALLPLLIMGGVQ
jgi:hypothetical protein